MPQKTSNVAKYDTDINHFYTKTKFMKKETTTSDSLKPERLTSGIYPMFRESLVKAVPDYRIVE